MEKTIDFLDEECTIIMGNYSNGNTAIQVLDEIGMPMATATVNPDVIVDPKVVVIKEYAENKGITEALINGGIIVPGVVSLYQVGFESVSSYRLV